MPKFYAFFDNGTYKVGCTGGSIYVFDQNNTELARFKGLSCIYQGAFRPGTNVFVAKSNWSGDDREGFPVGFTLLSTVVVSK